MQRLKAVLPSRWFGDVTPVLDTLLLGLATGWEYCFQLLQFVRAQTRLASATGFWLDAIAYDFFGEALRRGNGQPDGIFCTIVKRNILRPLATRHALTQALTDLTGRPPKIFEPRNTGDTGGYGTFTVNGDFVGSGLGYATSGGWGNLSLPYQFLMTALRPHGNGSANISGWGVNNGGYGGGALMYADSAIVSGHLSDREIMKEVARVTPIGVVAWVNIAN